MKNKKIFIMILLVLVMVLLFLIKQEYFINHKEKLINYLKTNSYIEEENFYQKTEGSLDEFYNNKIDSYKYYSFNIENKIYSFLSIEKVDKNIIKNLSINATDNNIEFTYTLDKDKGEIQVAGSYDLKTLKYECKEDLSICKEAEFKVLDFAKNIIKFYNQKEVYNYKVN